MTVIRELENHADSANYIASLGLICCVSSIILMLKFLGFKASLNFNTGKSKNDVYAYSITSGNISGGTYKLNREEAFRYESLSQVPKKITPSMVTLPPNEQENRPSNIKRTKSTDLTQTPINVPVHLRKNSPNVSADPRGGTSNNRDSRDLYNNKQLNKEEKKIIERKQKVAAQNDSKQQKLLEKEQKKQKKLAEKEEKLKRDKEDKLRKEQEQAKKKNKTKAPAQPSKTTQQPSKTTQPLSMPNSNRSNPLAQSAGPSLQNRHPVLNASSSAPVYSSNTLESSISRTTGPPPYDETPERLEVLPNTRDSTGNTSFGKRVEESSWDLVNQHRQQMAAPAVANRRRKQMVMDLNYNVGAVSSNTRVNNSEA